MDLLGRVAAAARGALDALLAPAEDPRETVVSAAERHAELLDRVRAALGLVRESQARVVERQSELEARVKRLHADAALAAERGDDGAARVALRRWEQARLEQRALAAQAEEIGREADRLAAVETELVDKVEAFRARQRLILARYTSAEARLQIAEALTGMSTELGDLGRELERAEASAEQMQARVTAIDQLVAEGSLAVPGSAPPDPMESDDGIDAELARIHARLAQAKEA